MCSTRSSKGCAPTWPNGSRSVSLEQLKDQARKAPSPLDALAALKAEGVSVIAEVKRASPSRGAMAAIDDPAALAGDYEAGGAAGDQRADRAAPVRRVARRPGLGPAGGADPGAPQGLRVSSYQLWEARAYGADLVLLIVAALEQSALVSLVERAL